MTEENIQLPAGHKLLRFWRWFREWPIEIGYAGIPLIVGICNWLISDEVVGQVSKVAATRALIQQRVFRATLISAVVWILFAICRKWRSKRIAELESTIEGLRRDEVRSRADAKQNADNSAARILDLEAEGRLLKDSIRNLLDGYLFNLAIHKLKFGTKGENCERITLYVADGDRCFVPVGRYASNMDHNSTGRPSYPIREGCIHRAWSNRSFFDNQFPDPVGNLDGYIARHGTYGVGTVTAKALTMKSRLYFGKSVLDQEGRYAIAVVVVESTDPERFTQDYLEKNIGDGEQEYLSRSIRVMMPHIPMPSNAAKAGF